MKVTIERNPAEEKTEVPFIAHIDTSDETIHKNRQYAVPVQVDYAGMKKQYHVDICGFALKAENPDRLPSKIENLIDGLINVARLPRHVFIARRAKKVYPIYTIGNEVWVTTPGGPVFQHVELAKVREYLTDYLHDTHVLGDKGLSDKLHVRGVDMTTLGLRRPVMYLKKRVMGETDFWAPVFESDDGQKIYTYAANAFREVPIENGQEIFILREIVAHALQTDRRLNDLLDLRPDRLMPHYWERVKALLVPEATWSIEGKDVPVYTKGNLWIGLEQRPDEERFGLYVADSANALRGRVVRDFVRRGMTTD